jgi:manganese transport system ATP-binding protein
MRVMAVTATDLVLGYGSAVAVDRSTFEIPRGGIAAVVGPNGSGKSTLLHAIAGLIRPLSGSIQVAVPSRDIAYVMQATRVNEALPVTVAEIVTMGRYAAAGAYGRLGRSDRTAVTEAMERTGVDDLATAHLHSLSGGQRQRVFVAQGLAQDHDLLLLDEPLTGIDLAAAQAIDRVIHDETGRGCTVVVTTHDLSEARAADHVILLAGRVIASGPPAEVLTDTNLAEAYGPALLHLDGGGMFVDDPAHRPASERHLHRDRTTGQADAERS